ncbi:hypothetical protein FGG76_26350, partial [Escherichia coli]
HLHEAKSKCVQKYVKSRSGIPDYALSRIVERFYSLPRANGQNSSCLGLAFVSGVARLFNRVVTMRKVKGVGVLATVPYNDLKL